LATLSSRQGKSRPSISVGSLAAWHVEMMWDTAEHTQHRGTSSAGLNKPDILTYLGLQPSYTQADKVLAPSL